MKLRTKADISCHLSLRCMNWMPVTVSAERERLIKSIVQIIIVTAVVRVLQHQQVQQLQRHHVFESRLWETVSAKTHRSRIDRTVELHRKLWGWKSTQERWIMHLPKVYDILSNWQQRNLHSTGIISPSVLRCSMIVWPHFAREFVLKGIPSFTGLSGFSLV